MPPTREDDGRPWRLLPWLVVVGLLARCTRLTESLWYDEIAVWREYGQHGPRFIVSHYFEPGNHIGHTLLSWGSVTAFADVVGPDLALRLPALLFSLVSIVTVYGMARALLGDRIAVIAGAAAALLPVAVLEGADARGYSAMIALAAGATWAWCVARERGGARRWIVYSVVAAIGAWIHPMTAFVPLGHGTWLVWLIARKRVPARETIAAASALVGSAVLTIALYGPVLVQIWTQRRSFVATTADQPGLLGPEGLHLLIQLGGAWSVFALPGLAVFALGAIVSARRISGRRAIGLTLSGLVVLMAAVAVTGSWCYARLALFAMPGAFLLIAVGVDELRRRSRLAGFAGAAVLAIAAAADLAMRPARQPLRDAIDHVRRTADPGERVLVVGLRHQVLDVYAGELALDYALHHGRDIGAHLGDPPPRWVILYYPRSVSDATYAAIDGAGYDETRRFNGWADWSNGDVVVYRRERPGDDGVR